MENSISKTPIYERIIALILLIFFFPILIIVGLLSLLDTRKNPIFIQERGLTLEKYRFRLIKFRTIRENSKVDKAYRNSSSILKKTYFYDNLSSIGKFLRKTGLDELPQLINIIMGEMRFIGPRALSIEDLQRIKEEFPDLYFERSKLKSLPGIIGLWQVNKDFNCSISHLIEMDINYENNKSFLLDVKIISKTFEIILFGYHIDSIVNGKKLKVYPLVIYATVITTMLIIFTILNKLGG
jgi:lipopolysaccharide/colanic/teichoic acid biosynthesis glycosyltransferase